MSQIVNDRPPVTYHKKTFFQRLALDFRQNKMVYLMWLPVLAFYLIFHYAPMGGLVIAFQNYKPFKGIAKSKFVGLEHFQEFLTGPYAWRTIRNTLVISLLQILIGFPMPIIFALLMNEVRCNPYTRVVLTVSSTGLFNVFRDLAGKPHLNFLAEPRYYRTIYIASGIWKQMGWSSILYLATLSSVDMSLYEAAAIDGAGRFRQMLSVTLPALVPIIAVQLIMRMGHIMGEGHQKTILLYNEMTWEVSDIVSSYVYRRGLKNNDYSFGAAVDFSKHVVKESLW